MMTSTDMMTSTPIFVLTSCARDNAAAGAQGHWAHREAVPEGLVIGAATIVDQANAARLLIAQRNPHASNSVLIRMLALRTTRVLPNSLAHPVPAHILPRVGNVDDGRARLLRVADHDAVLRCVQHSNDACYDRALHCAKVLIGGEGLVAVVVVLRARSIRSLLEKLVSLPFARRTVARAAAGWLGGIHQAALLAARVHTPSVKRRAFPLLRGHCRELARAR
jgi:hypothetical protein